SCIKYSTCRPLFDVVSRQFDASCYIVIQSRKRTRSTHVEPKLGRHEHRRGCHLVFTFSLTSRHFFLLPSSPFCPPTAKSPEDGACANIAAMCFFSVVRLDRMAKNLIADIRYSSAVITRGL